MMLAKKKIEVSYTELWKLSFIQCLEVPGCISVC